MSESLKVQFSRQWKESFAALRKEKRPELIAVELDVSVTTLWNWCKPETANIDLDRYDQVAIYCGWDTELEQREVVDLTTRRSNRWSTHSTVDLRELSPVLVLP